MIGQEGLDRLSFAEPFSGDTHVANVYPALRRQRAFDDRDKNVTLHESDLQRRILREHLASLEPRRDYHLLSLNPVMFEYVDFAPRTALIVVSTINTRHLSETALAEGYGGIVGSYLFLDDRLLRKHRAHGQRIGTGYISSKNCLFRELNRGVEWIFSNHAAKLQTICRRL